VLCVCVQVGMSSTVSVREIESMKREFHARMRDVLSMMKQMPRELLLIMRNQVSDLRAVK